MREPSTASITERREEVGGVGVEKGGGRALLADRGKGGRKHFLRHALA